MFNSVSQYKPKQKQIQSVYSYDYIAPTSSSSVQISLALDFDKSRVTLWLVCRIILNDIILIYGLQSSMSLINI